MLQSFNHFCSPPLDPARSSVSPLCCRAQNWTQRCRCGLSRVTQHGGSTGSCSGDGREGEEGAQPGALCTHRDLPPWDVGVSASTAWGELIPAAGSARSIRRCPCAALVLGQWLPGESPHSPHREASQPWPSPLARLPTGDLPVPGAW